MKVKAVIAALVLVATPGIAMAMCSWERTQSASQCQQGTTWDEASQTCIAPVSS